MARVKSVDMGKKNEMSHLSHSLLGFGDPKETQQFYWKGSPLIRCFFVVLGIKLLLMWHWVQGAFRYTHRLRA